MANVAKRKDGTKIISYVGADGQRRFLRLGKITLKAADSIRAHVEHLNNAQITKQPLETETAKWLTQIGKPLYDKLVKFGLAQPGMENIAWDRTKLGPFLDAYIAKRTDVKKSTITVYKRTRRHLVEFFGEDKPINKITTGDANDWRRWLKDTQKLGKNTIGRTCGIAKQFFHDAVDRELIVKNPFAKLSAQVNGNKERQYHVTREEAQMVLDACPDEQWQLLFALSRYGGLRCPSEHLRLRWSDVDWEQGRITIYSPKTEHLDGKDQRQIPIFPELRPYLEKARDQADSEFVISRYRNTNANLRTQLERIIAKAGLKPWPKLFHNLRATRETELVEQHPLHVACAWIGNSKRIAAEHYLHVTEADYEKATGLKSATLAPPQTVPGDRKPSQNVTGEVEIVENYVTLPPVAMLCDGNSGRYRTRTCDPKLVELVL